MATTTLLLGLLCIVLLCALAFERARRVDAESAARHAQQSLSIAASAAERMAAQLEQGAA